MEIVKIGILGVAGVMLALQFRSEDRNMVCIWEQ